ncbi:ribonuclease H-like domain-containing protein [Tanacetum coccineum]
MEHYLAHTDYPIWEVIQNGNGPVSITTYTQGQIKVLPPRTTEEILARERERKARTTLLMALPEDHLAKFHKMTDAKEMWDAIKSRFGRNDESKKMQKYILKQQFEGFSVSNSEGLHKGYDRFQSLLSQLEIHGAGVSTEDANQKFLRSLPSAWSQVSLIMRTKPGVDSLSFDDLYNNLRVFENDVKGSTASFLSMQNVAFVSENTSSTNDVSTAYGVSNPSDLEQLDKFDLEEMDLKWQMVMILMRIKKFYKKTGRNLQFDAKEPVGFDKTKVECYNCHKTGHFARECRTKGNQDSKRRDAWNFSNKDERKSCKQEDSKILVTNDGEGVDWTSHSEEKEDFALMACNSLGLDTEAYTQALKKVEAQLVAHQQEAEKEKEDLKAKVEKWHNSSKNLSLLQNSQMSANDKFGLGYGDHRYDGILSYENEVLQSVFMNKESDLENQPLYDRFVTAEGMHVVPPPMTGNYMPSGPDIEIDYSQFTYGPKQSQTSESETQTSDFDTCESDCSVETHEYLPEPTVNVPKLVTQPKVWFDAPIIEEYESDSKDEHVSQPIEEQETTSFANQQIKTHRETVKNQFTHSKNPKVDKKGLGYGFATKACFVCGILSHLIRYCDFREKRMAKQVELNKQKGKGSSQREIRPVWNNVQRVNHKNQFVPTTVLTRTGKILVITARTSGTNTVNTVRTSGTNTVNTARHNFNSQAVLTNAARKISTDYPHRTFQNKGIVDSGCSRHMTGNKAYLAEYQDFNGGPVAFGGCKGYITGKGPQERLYQNAGIEANINAGDSEIEAESAQDYFVLPIWSSYTSTVKSSKVNNAGEEPTKHPDFKQVDKEDQVFLDELERLKRQEQDANDATEALRKEFAQETEDLLLQGYTASPYGGLSFTDLTNTDQDDSEIPALEEIYDNPTDVIFQHQGLTYSTSTLNSWRSTIMSSKTKQSDKSLELGFYLPYGKKAIGTKLVYINKKDERRVVVRNKAMLVAQGHRQDEGIDYDEVYKVVKVSLVYYQAPETGYATLSTFLLKNGYRRGTIDKTLFIKKDKHDIILVQVYVDDIIFGSTKKSWCDEFEVLMKSRFQMSSMGELTFFLGLQVKQKEDGIFISQDKYVAEILKKFDFVSVKTASTPIETQKPLVKDEEASDVDVHLYRSMIGSLMYLTASRPDIMFAVSKGAKPKLGLWYPRVSSFDLEAYSDSDYARANLDRKSTIGGC